MKHNEFFLTNVFELVAGYQIPMLSQRILGSPGGKHCKSLEENVWRKVVSLSKAVILFKE